MDEEDSLEIRENAEDKADILNQIHKLSQVLQNMTTSNQHIIAYTDGSTETKKRKSRNSGYGIHITTRLHSPIYSEGGTVRSDGNNFVAEMAAATVVIKALPPNRTLTIYADSVAAIQALEQGLISESVSRHRVESGNPSLDRQLPKKDTTYRFFMSKRIAASKTQNNKEMIALIEWPKNS